MAVKSQGKLIAVLRMMEVKLRKGKRYVLRRLQPPRVSPIHMFESWLMTSKAAVKFSWTTTISTLLMIQRLIERRRFNLP